MATIPMDERNELKQEFDLTLSGYTDVVDIEIVNDDILKVAKETNTVSDAVNGVKNYTSLTDIRLNSNNNQLYKIIKNMATNSVLRVNVEQDDVYYPISGLLEVIKIADYTAKIMLYGPSNDAYILFVNRSNWNEIFPEDPIS